MKRAIQTYTFSPGGAGVGTVTFTNFTTISLDKILLVVNVTRGVVIFNLTDPNAVGTVATNVLTLGADTSSHNAADKLYIVYDDVDLDYDSGAGTMSRHAMGLIVPGSGGPVAITGDASNGLDVDVTRVGGTVTTTEDPSTSSGGLSLYHVINVSTNSDKANVKASAGRVYEILAFNLNAAPVYLKLHNTSGTPTVGSGVIATFMVPGNTTGTGLIYSSRHGIYCSSGIGVTLTSGIADADTSTVTASTAIIQIGYK